MFDETLLQFSARQQLAFWAQARFLSLPWGPRAGKSHLLAAWAVYRLLTRSRWNIDVFCDGEESAQRFAALCTSLCAELHVNVAAPPAAGGIPIKEMAAATEGDSGGHVAKAAGSGTAPLASISLRTRQQDRRTLRVWRAGLRAIRACRGDDLIIDDLGRCRKPRALWQAASDWTETHPAACCRIAGGSVAHRRSVRPRRNISRRIACTQPFAG